MTVPFDPGIKPEERWEPPTLRSVRALDDNPLVTCGCGRRVNADMMRVTGEGYACDACHETLFRTLQVTREAFAAAQGAPIAVIEKARGIDAAIARASEKGPAPNEEPPPFPTSATSTD